MMDHQEIKRYIENTKRRLVSWLVLTIVFGTLSYLEVLPWMQYLTVLALLDSIFQLCLLIYLTIINWQK